MARELVRDFPERIVPQVEAHRYRNVRDQAASLVVAIRENWPTDPPLCKQTAEEIRRAHRSQRQAAEDAQAAEKALKKAQEEKVKDYWNGLSEAEKSAFEEEAIEASPERENIRSLDPGSPIYKGHRAVARWEHVRRKLGLLPEADS